MQALARFGGTGPWGSRKRTRRPTTRAVARLLSARRPPRAGQPPAARAPDQVEDQARARDRDDDAWRGVTPHEPHHHPGKDVSGQAKKNRLRHGHRIWAGQRQARERANEKARDNDRDQVDKQAQFEYRSTQFRAPPGAYRPQAAVATAVRGARPLMGSR